MNGFKKTVLTATAVFVLGLGVNAHAFMVDSFDTEQGPIQDGLVDATAVTSGPIAFANTDLVGASRLLSVSATGNEFGGQRHIEALVSGGSMSVSTDSGVTGVAMVNWSGFAPTDLTVPDGLGIGILVTVLDSDPVGTNTARFSLTKSDNTIITELLDIPDVDSPNSQGHLFTFGGAFANATDITNINLTITADQNFDVTVDLIRTEVVPEPGTILLFGSGLAGLGFWRYRKSQA